MQRRSSVVTAVILSSLWGAPALAEGEAPAGAEAHTIHRYVEFAEAEVTIRSADGKVSIPFNLVNNHVVFQAAIQGTRLDVVLDTGMPMDGVMLYETDKVSRLALKYDEGATARIGGAGAGGGHVEARMAQGITIDIGDLRITGATAIVAPPLMALASYHDAVIGASLFKNLVVAIDYDARRITLSAPGSWAPPEGSVAVPLTIEHGMPFADVTLIGGGGRRMPTPVVVDLGAAHPISLNLGAVDGLEAPAGAIHAVVGLGVSGRLQGRVGRIAGLEIGGLLLKDVVATFPDPDSQHPGGMQERGGNLGDGVLQRFNVAFDYAHKRMLLTPNQAFAKPFEWDMSGLWIQPDDKGALRIESIVENSPARTAGLAVGDILTRVNGRAVTPGDLAALREKLRVPAATFEMAVLRDGRTIRLTLMTMRLV